MSSDFREADRPRFRIHCLPPHNKLSWISRRLNSLNLIRSSLGAIYAHAAHIVAHTLAIQRTRGSMPAISYCPGTVPKESKTLRSHKSTENSKATGYVLVRLRAKLRLPSHSLRADNNVRMCHTVPSPTY